MDAMWWADIPADEVRVLERLAPTDPTRIRARLRGAFRLRHSDDENAFALAKEEAENAELRGDRHSIAMAYVTWAYTGPVEDPQSLLNFLKEACEILRRVEDRQFEIYASDLLATIFEGMGDYPTALGYTQRTLTLTRQVGDRLFEGYGLSSLAGILTAAGDLEDARQKLQEALDIAAEIEVDRLYSRLLVRKGRVERDLGHLDAALDHFREATEVARRTGNLFTEIDAVSDIAKTHLERDNLEDAETLYRKALGMMDEDARAIVGPTSMLGLARVLLRTDRAGQAVELIIELQALADVFGMLPIQAEANELLANAYKQTGDFERAFDALTEHLKLKETIMQGEADRAVKRLQVKVDLDAAKKDAEIYRLKYVELETMQTQLLESERMAVIGTLTAGLAHEMNSPLGVVKSGLDTTRRALTRLDESLPPNRDRVVETSRQALLTTEASARTAVVRLEGLVDSLRRFTRLDESEYQLLDLADGLDATIAVLSTTLADGIRIERDFESIPLIRGWPGSLNQAFLTLMKNAAEALGSSGTIRVMTRRQPTDEVAVRIADNGPGIPAEVRDRLFDLELSRDGPRARFRVGLATVRSVVQRHHGRIDVTSAPGQGTEFCLYFPTPD